MTTVPEASYTPRVLIFAPENRSFYGLDALDAASKAAWSAVMYNSVRIAAEEADEQIDAIVTCVVAGKSGIQPLIKISDELEIPRAIMAENPSRAKKYLRPDSQDRVLPVCVEFPVTTVANWLSTLVLKQVLAST